MSRRPSRVDPNLLALARPMRHVSAPAEQVLWRCLRNRRLNGFKFRRQVPAGRYVADFYCAECRLVVEADGSSHFDRVEEDRARTEWLNANGYAVVRYRNTDVFDHLIPVLENLLAVCERRAGRGVPSRTSDGERPSPRPSPPSTGERGKRPLPHVQS